MDEWDKKLEELALAVKSYPPEIADSPKTPENIKLKRARKKALSELVNVIQKSGKLFCRGRSNFPLEVYNQALRETLMYVCRNIHNYDPNKGKVMTLINFVLDKKFKEAIRKYRDRQEILSLDAPIQTSLCGNRDESAITLGDTVQQPESTVSEYAEVRQFIVDDRGSVFRNRHIQKYPQANFRAIALLYLDGYQWQEIAAAVGIDAEKYSTVQSFYSRSVRYFAAIFRDYLLGN